MLCLCCVHVFDCVAMSLMCNVLFLSLFLSLSVFDMPFCVYFCMFPVCPLCCFIVIPIDLVSEINDDDNDDSEMVPLTFV